ncbi:hypothetical protein F4813DRAFT_394365, partial [Daldinia decipiens]|uniref:uncharacterized protein n=1 Tax=Daldinia decipiens TaxID=326647 RepID=UPI0020C1D262
LLSYALAQIFSSVLGRKITYVDLTEPELVERWAGVGLPAAYAAVLASMDAAVRRGSEELASDAVRATTGRDPRAFRDFVEANKATWAQS